ncbi:MAG: TraR/DksA family transcriptional regulator [Sulfuricaulis sp.]|uniref:TraR/DksA family transcriptional regulator n=1 Tax=Sulfuricaulis sp. TaxID=2003553 RepID=UPI0025FF5B37|nr:TraR/DksA C4-type zinc finger protein [Sulfuricaulis sp.]MCR4346651.1 TraR/DksA family transcriptional regulator [Sulfuricaulis sp.]
MPELSEKQLQQFEQRLRNRREELREIIHRELANSKQEDFTELAGMVHDAGEESFAELLRGINIATRTRELEEIRDVEASLERIKNGIYGTCVDCNDKIVLERLDAYPTAKRCINCQSRNENRRGGRDATPSL